MGFFHIGYVQLFFSFICNIMCNQLKTVNSHVKTLLSFYPKFSGRKKRTEQVSLSSLNVIDRRRLQQIQLVQGPNRILLTLEDLTFINPQLSKKVNTISADNHVKTHTHTRTHTHTQ